MVAASIQIGPPDQLLICNDRNETQTACDIHLIRRSMHPRGALFALLKAKKNRSELSENNPRLFFFILFIHNDVGVKRSKILLQASLHQLSDLLTLVSYNSVTTHQYSRIGYPLSIVS